MRARLIRILVFTLLLWCGWAVSWTRAPEDPDPDCYLSAAWVGDRWEYGDWECLADQEPPPR
jgi:hypothetical protein